MTTEEKNYWQRQLTRRRVLRGAALGSAGLAAAAVIGCAEEEKPAATPAATPRPTTPGATPAATPTPAAVQPKKGGTLIGYDDTDVASFDLYLTWSYKTMMYASMTYPRLYKFKVYQGAPPNEFAVEPDLAKGVEASADGLTYSFKLLPATWEDKAPVNGRKLTAAEVAYNWERFTKIHPNRELFRDVDRVEAPADDTVVFKMKKPLGSFINHIGHQGMFYTYPRELIEQEKTRTEQVSAGPFVLDGKYEVGVGATYKRNPKYYRGPDRPYVDAVQYRIIPDASARLAALRAKQLDTTFWVGISQLDEASLRRDLPKATFTEYPYSADAQLTLDASNPLFQDERVRQAISMMLDRDALLKVSGGKGVWATHLSPLPKWWLDPKDKAKFGENAKYYQRDLAEAKKLLDAAGVSLSALKGLPFYAALAWYPTRKSEFELAHAQLKEAGIETDLKVVEFTAFYSIAVLKQDHEGFAWDGHFVGADPNEYYTLFWEPGSSRSGRWGPVLAKDVQLQQLLEKQRREPKEEERVKIVYDIQRYMSAKMYNVPAVSPMLYHVRQDHLKDMHWIWTYAQGTEYLEKAWLEKA